MIGAPGAAATGLYPVLRGWRDVWSANPREISAQQRADHEVEPLRISHTVAVGVGNNLAGGGSGTDVAGCT